MNMKKNPETKHQKKQFRRTAGDQKGYQTPIILDAFEFWEKDIGEPRFKYYIDSLNKLEK